jgi:Na+/H+ antiporter NhaA
MAATVSIYLAFNLGGTTAHGCGIAMSTDTAFALRVLAVVARRLPDRLRAFILTVVVVDARTCPAYPEPTPVVPEG